MQCCDTIGYVASSLVLATFAMKDIVRLRIVAISSNVVFLAYGLTVGLPPVWLLHAVLLPMNVWRLSQALEVDRPNWSIERLLRGVANRIS